MVGEVVAGRYRLEELVGTGGMSTVYRAHDTRLERDVALKLLHEHYVRDEEYVERFRREARSAAQLTHPNVVTVIDRGEQDGRQFIVFEYVDGESLKALVERAGPLPVAEAIRIAIQVARGLAFAHGQGLVHRDVKPQNVLLNGDGQAKVTDFGIARSVDMHGITQTGTMLGTSHYIAPEQARGEPVDAQTDVYSLGVVLYELLTGDVPFSGDSFVAVAMKHVAEPVPNILTRRSDVPPRLAAALDRGMAKEPSERFSSMGEFALELEACLDELEPDARQTMVVPARVRHEPRVRRARARRRRWPLALIAGGVSLVALAAAGALVSDGADDEPNRGATPSRPIRLTGVGSFDPPPGDGREHDDDAPKATDRDPATYWTTEHYRSGLTKPGVGLVVDAGRAVEPSSFMVATDTPGFTAEIRAGSSPDGPFTRVSANRTVQPQTRFAITANDPARYYVVWVTRLAGPAAHVNEVRAS